jgi:hypothetical protein
VCEAGTAQRLAKHGIGKARAHLCIADGVQLLHQRVQLALTGLQHNGTLQ